MFLHFLKRFQGLPDKASLAKPSTEAKLQHFASVCEKAATGNLDARILVEDGDSIADSLGGAINRMLDSWDAYVRETSAAMDQCSHGRYHRPILLRGLSGGLKKSAAIINRAALKMKNNAGEITVFEATRKQVIENVRSSINFIRTACEQLGGSATEILRQADESASLAASVAKEMEQARLGAEELTQAAATITSMITIISDLARQTNLIALNASIEAARAGVHGLGFAVVAEEVKVLSHNTAEATEKISGQVASIQNSIAGVQRTIGAIGASINTLDHDAAAIDSAVAGQVAATSEISRRVSEVESLMSAAEKNKLGPSQL